MSKTVLVLESGGPASMAALKSIRHSRLPARTVACDINPLSPARLFADVFLNVPSPSDPTYIPTIIGIIDQYDIGLVLPTFHHGFPQLRTIGSPAFITDFETGLLCEDKLAFYRACLRHGLPVPETRLLHETHSIDAPAYIKPRFGVGSKQNYITLGNAQLQAVKTLAGTEQDFLVQTILRGQEWSVEVLITKQGELHATCYMMHELKAGNTSIAEIRTNPQLTEFAGQIRSKLGLTAAFNLQVFIDDGAISIVEINPRHGSGIEFAYHAGSNYIGYWITEDSSWLKPAREGVYNRYLAVGTPTV